ncbi:putative P2Y purinoceptor 10 isoform X1 [Ahaetulla prasina]|uniref:putative P2Y purinoceptor 10 isoform X1 n=2 Tax=Ahaetulla prasina TaxID=499056 RepID=UPI00264925EC|nr:putative P2Y purinoceptor 10 isoform X1 [Ahaetulla prasina]
MLQMRVQNLSIGGTSPSPFTGNGTEMLGSPGMNCSEPKRDFQHAFYAATYSIIFIPGLLTNSIALWMLCLFIRKQNKAIIFLLNLATADFIHVLSLPLRIYYYVNDKWPFGLFLCQLCFYLKYLNMYASICFLTCISVQRYLFLFHPFMAKNWKKRYDVAISAAVWLVVGLACLTFPLLRKTKSSETCFSDLNIEKFQNKAALIGMLMVAELVGFLFPLAIIVYCTSKTRASLQEHQIPLENTGEKQKALRMVYMCAVVFFVCFAPYHLMFFFFMLVKEDVVKGCAVKQSVLYLHPFFLSLASFNCCLDPFLYFFVTSEFHDRIPTYSSLSFRSRLLSKESASSVKG